MPFDLSQRYVAYLETKAYQIDTLGRRWDSAKHPRDSKGRFIETGGIVRVGVAGGLAKVMRTLLGNKVEVMHPDGSRSVQDARQLTMVRRPDGSKPTADARKVVKEDKVREADPNRGDGLTHDDHHDLSSIPAEDPQDEDHQAENLDGAPDVPEAFTPSRDYAEEGDWIAMAAKDKSGRTVYGLAEVTKTDGNGKATHVRLAGSKNAQGIRRSEFPGDGDGDTLIPKSDLGDPKEFEVDATRGVKDPLTAADATDLVEVHAKPRTPSKAKGPRDESGKPAPVKVSGDDLRMQTGPNGVADGSMYFLGKRVGRIYADDSTRTDEGQHSYRGAGAKKFIVRGPEGFKQQVNSFDSGREVLARHLTRLSNGEGGKKKPAAPKVDAPNPDAPNVDVPNAPDANAPDPNAPDAPNAPSPDAPNVPDANAPEAPNAPERRRSTFQGRGSTPDEYVAVPNDPEGAVNLNRPEDQGGGHVGYVRPEGNGFAAFDANNKRIAVSQTHDGAMNFLARKVNGRGVPQAPSKPTRTRRPAAPAAAVPAAPNTPDVPGPAPAGVDAPDNAPDPNAPLPTAGKWTSRRNADGSLDLIAGDGKTVMGSIKRKRNGTFEGRLEGRRGSNVGKSEQSVMDQLYDDPGLNGPGAAQRHRDREAAGAQARPTTVREQVDNGSATSEGATSEPVRPDSGNVLADVPAEPVRDGGRDASGEGSVLRDPGAAGDGSDRGHGGRPAPASGGAAGTGPDQPAVDRGQEGRGEAGRGTGDAGARVPDAGAGDRGSAPSRVDAAGVGGRDRGVTAAVPDAAAPAKPSKAPAKATRFVPQGQSSLGTGDAAERLRNNIAALKVLRAIQADGDRPATKAEQKVLAKWSGWGAVKKLFVENDQTFAKERAELKSLMSDKEWAAARENQLNAHYTDASLVKSVWRAVKNLGFTHGDVLEPGSGSGNFIGHAPEGAHMTGVELDPITAGISKALYPDADIHQEGFERSPFNKDVFDAVVGNVPFGNYPIYDNRSKTKYSSVHNGFILKSLDTLKPGGTMAVVTSQYTMDGQSPADRRAMYAKADLIGAVRLPAGTHKDAAGTDVVTDVLLFRKRKAGEAPGDGSWVESHPATHPDGSPVTGILGKDGEARQLWMNDYFTKNRQDVLGTIENGGYNGMQVTGHGDLGPKLDAALDRITKAAPRKFDAAPDGDLKRAKRDYGHAAEGRVSFAGEHTDPTKRGKAATSLKFTKIEDGRPVPLDVPSTQQDEFRRLLELRDLTHDLLELEGQTKHDDDPQLVEARRRLGVAYDAYVHGDAANPKGYGPITRYAETERGPDPKTGEDRAPTRKSPPVMRLFTEDPDFADVFGLEKGYDEESNTAEKADLFTTRQVSRDRQVAQTTKDPDEAIELVAEQGNGLTYENLGKTLGVTAAQARKMTKGKVFTDPDTGRLVRREDYLSGHVRNKLAAAEAKAAEDPAFQENLDALREVTPPEAKIADIPLQLGSTWIGPDVVTKFARHLMGNDTEVKLDELTGSWSVSRPKAGSWGRSPQKEFVTWGTHMVDSNGDMVTSHNGDPVGDRSFYDLLDKVLKQQHHNIKVYRHHEDADGTKYRVLDVKASEAATDKAQEIADEFTDWVWGQADVSSDLAARYTDLFRSIVPRSYDGAKQRAYPGMAQGKDLMPHQNAAVTRGVSEPSVLFEHVVGAGKTFTLAALAMELKRLGMVDKPVLAVPGHMLAQWASEFKELYPTAKILAADSDVLSGSKGRKAFAAKARSSDWDIVLMTHKAFESIPVSAEAFEKYLGDELDLLRKQKQRAVKDMDTKASARIEKEIKKAEAKIREQLANRKDDEGVNFESIGFDYVMADEAHVYKNLNFSTNMQGIASPEGAGRARDMHMKLNVLRSMKGDDPEARIAGFATGTPISNSLAEMYTMTRFLRPDLLEQANVADFDAWAATFARVEAKVEQDTSGTGWVERTRMRGFTDALGDALRIWRTFSDTKVFKDLPYLKRPAIKGGERQVHVVKKTDLQQRALGSFKYRLEHLPSGRPKPGDDTHVAIIGDGRRAALDPRLMSARGLREAGIDPNDPELMDAPSPKIAEAVDNIWRIHQENATRRYKVKHNDPDDAPLAEIPGAAQMVMIDADSPKKDRWSSYQAIKDGLVAKGMKPEEIAFVQDAAGSASKKAKLFDDVRQGRVKVIVGATTNLGTGTNVQNRLIALHQLDGSWKPADIEQREGRILRQGNQHDEVELHVYVTQGTHDVKVWDMTAYKQAALDAIASGDFNMRELEFADDVDPLTDFETVVGDASEDPLVADRRDLTPVLKRLRKAADRHRKGVANAKSSIAHSERRQGDYRRALDTLNKAIDARTDISGDAFAMQVSTNRYGDGSTYGTRKDAADALHTRLSNIMETGYFLKNDEHSEGEIGQLGGFHVLAHSYMVYPGNQKQLHLELTLPGASRHSRTPLPVGKVTVTMGDLEKENGAQGVITRLENKINGLERYRDESQAGIEHEAREIETAREVTTRPFAKADELTDLERQAELLDTLLTKNEKGAENTDTQDTEGAGAEHTGLSPEELAQRRSEYAAIKDRNDKREAEEKRRRVAEAAKRAAEGSKPVDPSPRERAVNKTREEGRDAGEAIDAAAASPNENTTIKVSPDELNAPAEDTPLDLETVTPDPLDDEPPTPKDLSDLAGDALDNTPIPPAREGERVDGVNDGVDETPAAGDVTDTPTADAGGAGDQPPADTPAPAAADEPADQPDAAPASAGDAAAPDTVRVPAGDLPRPPRATSGDDTGGDRPTTSTDGGGRAGTDTITAPPASPRPERDLPDGPQTPDEAAADTVDRPAATGGLGNATSQGSTLADGSPAPSLDEPTRDPANYDENGMGKVTRRNGGLYVDTALGEAEISRHENGAWALTYPGQAHPDDSYGTQREALAALRTYMRDNHGGPDTPATDTTPDTVSGAMPDERTDDQAEAAAVAAETPDAGVDTPSTPEERDAADKERVDAARADAEQAALAEGASKAEANRAGEAAAADEATADADLAAARPIPPAPVSEEHADELDYQAKTPTQMEGEKYPLTTQQQKVADAVVADGKDTKVEAKAGSGKTSTLEAIARRFLAADPKKRIAYIAFNKSVQVEAEGRMPGNTEARTGHSIAFAWRGKKWTDRKFKSPTALRRADEIANQLGITKNLDGMEPAQQAQAIMRAVGTYANSADDVIGTKHFEGVSEDEAKKLLPYAKKAWADLESIDGKINVNNDHIRKMWALSRPDFSKPGSGLKTPAHVLFLDEAQDTPPVLAKVVADQAIQKVIVGDADQAIYGFTGATDYLSTAKADVALPLTKSWRFGPAIADMGNRFLQVLGSKDRVIGGGAEGRIVRDMQGADAILVRSNGGMIGEIVREQEAGRIVGVPKGTKADLLSLVESARYLKGEGRAPSVMHEDLAMYRTWDEFVAAATDEQNPDPKARMLYNIISTHGLDGLERIISQVRELDDGGLAGAKLQTLDDRLVLTGAFMLNQRVKERTGESMGRLGWKWDGNAKSWTATGTPEQREAALARLREAIAGEKPDVVVSTAHKAKGLEWGRVRIGDDFRGPEEDKNTGELRMPEPEELKLAYVAVTRAEKELDPGSLGWVLAHSNPNGEGNRPNPDAPTADVTPNEDTVRVAPEDLPTVEGPAVGTTPERNHDDLRGMTDLELAQEMVRAVDAGDSGRMAAIEADRVRRLRDAQERQAAQQAEADANPYVPTGARRMANITNGQLDVLHSYGDGWANNPANAPELRSGARKAIRGEEGGSIDAAEARALAGAAQAAGDSFDMPNEDPATRRDGRTLKRAAERFRELADRLDAENAATLGRDETADNGSDGTNAPNVPGGAPNGPDGAPGVPGGLPDGTGIPDGTNAPDGGNAPDSANAPDGPDGADHTDGDNVDAPTGLEDAPEADLVDLPSDTPEQRDAKRRERRRRRRRHHRNNPLNNVGDPNDALNNLNGVGLPDHPDLAAPVAGVPGEGVGRGAGDGTNAPGTPGDTGTAGDTGAPGVTGDTISVAPEDLPTPPAPAATNTPDNAAPDATPLDDAEQAARDRAIVQFYPGNGTDATIAHFGLVNADEMWAAHTRDQERQRAAAAERGRAREAWEAGRPPADAPGTADQVQVGDVIRRGAVDYRVTTSEPTDRGRFWRIAAEPVDWQGREDGTPAPEGLHVSGIFGSQGGWAKVPQAADTSGGYHPLPTTNEHGGIDMPAWMQHAATPEGVATDGAPQGAEGYYVRNLTDSTGELVGPDGAVKGTLRHGVDKKGEPQWVGVLPDGTEVSASPSPFYAARGLSNRAYWNDQPKHENDMVPEVGAGDATATATPATDGAPDAPAGTPINLATVPRTADDHGTIRLPEGTVAQTAGDRATTPFPRTDFSSPRKATNSRGRVDDWLLENAKAEADVRGINHMLPARGSDMTPAERDMAERILFDPSMRELDGSARPSRLRPLGGRDATPDAAAAPGAEEVNAPGTGVATAPEGQGGVTEPGSSATSGTAPATPGTPAAPEANVPTGYDPERWPIPEPERAGNGQITKATAARALYHGAQDAGTDDDKAALHMARRALTNTDWSTHGGPEAQGASLANLDQRVLDKIGSTREDLDNRIAATEALANHLDRAEFGGKPLGSMKIAKAKGEEPTLSDYLRRYAAGYRAARAEHQPAATPDTPADVTPETPTQDLPDMTPGAGTLTGAPSGEWTEPVDGVTEAEVPGEWRAEVYPEGDGYGWAVHYPDGRVKAGRADDAEAAKRAVRNEVGGHDETTAAAPATPDTAAPDETPSNTPADAPTGDRPTAEEETTPAATPATEEETAAPVINGEQAGWVPTGSLEPGDIAQVDGDNGNGSATTRTGHVLGTPEPVEVHEPGKEPVDGHRVTVGEDRSGMGDRGTVLSEAEAMAARAERDKEASDSSNPESAPESTILGGHTGEAIPTDRNGLGLYPGSVVTGRDGRTGRIRETGDNEVRIRWDDESRDRTVQPGTLTVDEAGHTRPAGWNRHGQLIRNGQIVETPGGQRGTVEHVDGDQVGILTPGGMVYEDAAGLKVVGRVAEGDSGKDELRESVFDAPTAPEGMDVRPTDPIKPDALPDGVTGALVNLKPEQLAALNDLGLDTDSVSPYDVQQAAARVRHGLPISTEQATALSAHLRALLDNGGLPGPQARALRRVANRLDAAGSRGRGEDVTPDAPEAAVPERVTVADVGRGDVIAVPDPLTGQVTWGTVVTKTPKVVRDDGTINPQIADTTIELGNGDRITLALGQDAEVYRLPDMPEDPNMAVPAGPADENRAFVEPRVAERLGDAVDAVVEAAIGGDDEHGSIEDLAAAAVDAMDNGDDHRDQRNADDRLETSLGHSGVDEETAAQVHDAAKQVADEVANDVADTVLNTVADAEPLPGESEKDAAQRIKDLIRERAALGVDRDAAVERAVNGDTAPTDAERAAARGETVDAMRADLFAMADELARHGDTVSANALSEVAARLAGRPDPIHVERAVRALSMGRPAAPRSQLRAHVWLAFQRARARFIEAIKRLMGTGRKALMSFKAAVAAARAEWHKDNDREADDLVEHAAKALTTLEDARDVLPGEPQDFAGRVQFWRDRLPENPAEFGRVPGRRGFGQLTLDALRGGRTLRADQGDGLTLDRAADGGPGEKAMRDTEAVSGLGGALDDEVAARVRAAHPDLGSDPAATVREARRYAKSLAGEHRGDTGDAELDAMRQKANADAEDKAKRYANALAESTLAVLAESREMGPVGDAKVNIKGRSDTAEEVAALRWAEQHFPTDWLTAAGTVEAQAGRMSGYSDDGTITVAPLGEPNRDGAGEYGRSALQGLARHMETAIPGLRDATWAYHWNHTSSGDVGRRDRRGHNALGRLANLFPAAGLERSQVARPGDYPDAFMGQEHDGEQPSWWPVALSALFSGDEHYLDHNLRKFMMGLLAYYERTRR